MKILVVYDSVYGNTQKLAEEIAKELKTKAMRVGEVGKEMIREADEVVIGSPTHGGRPTEPMGQWMTAIGEVRRGKQVRVFDTRMEWEKQNFFLKWLMGRIGYAAEKMADKLQSLGAIAKGKPKGFIVQDKGGPLKPGEMEKASEWVRA